MVMREGGSEGWQTVVGEYGLMEGGGEGAEARLVVRKRTGRLGGRDGQEGVGS